MTCTHDTVDRDIAVSADGYCPLCQATEIERLRAERDFAIAAHDGQVQDKDYLAGQLVKQRNAIIEECARAAESYRKDLWPTAIPRADFVAAIRALKDKP